MSKSSSTASGSVSVSAKYRSVLITSFRAYVISLQIPVFDVLPKELIHILAEYYVPNRMYLYGHHKLCVESLWCWISHFMLLISCCWMLCVGVSIPIACGWDLSRNYSESSCFTDADTSIPAQIVRRFSVDSRVPLSRVVTGGRQDMWSRLWGSQPLREMAVATTTTLTPAINREVACFAVKIDWRDQPSSGEAAGEWSMLVVGVARAVGEPKDEPPASFAADESVYVLYSDRTMEAGATGNADVYRAHSGDGTVWLERQPEFFGRTIGIAVHLQTGQFTCFINNKMLAARLTAPLETPESRGVAFTIPGAGDYFPYVGVANANLRIELIPEWQPPASYFQSLSRVVTATKPSARNK